MDDSHWLAEFVESKSEPAFARLVERHVNLVYSAALRQLKDRHLAEDITQLAFTALARKAASLRREASIGAWLLVTTRYLALDALKAQSRRQHHERKAAEMVQNPSATSEEKAWAEVAPYLDAALASLNVHDRRAITLRYFQQMSLRQVADAMDISLESARQRVHRATLRMRKFFSRRGVAVPASLIGTLILVNAVHGAPAGLAATSTSAALTSNLASTGGTSATHGLFNGSPGKVLLMALTKAKVAAGIAIALLLSGGAVVGYRTLKPAPPPIVEIASLPRINDPTEPEWKKRFNSAYALSDGQILKQVPPPVIPERQQFWNMQNAGHAWPLTHDESLMFTWDGSKPTWTSISSGSSGASFIIFVGAKLQRWQIDSTLPLNLPLPGDWVIRKDATPDQVMHALAEVVSQKLGHTVRFEKHAVQSEVLIARGSYHFAPLSGKTSNDVVNLIGGEPKTQNGPAPYERAMTVAELLSFVEFNLGKRVIDETGSSKVQLKVRDHLVTQDPVLLLQNIAAQTSIRFDREPRMTEIWSMVNPAASQPALMSVR